MKFQAGVAANDPEQFAVEQSAGIDSVETYWCSSSDFGDDPESTAVIIRFTVPHGFGSRDVRAAIDLDLLKKIVAALEAKGLRT